MKFFKLLSIAVISCFLFTGGVSAAVFTEAQIADLITAAEAGGDVEQVASDLMAPIAGNIFNGEYTDEEIQAQVAAAIDELSTAVENANIPNANLGALINSVIRGAVKGGFVAAIKAEAENPNLNAQALMASVTTATANAIVAIAARNPNIDAQTMIASVNELSEEMGLEPIDPEAYEAADQGRVRAGSNTGTVEGSGSNT